MKRLALTYLAALLSLAVHAVADARTNHCHDWSLPSTTKTVTVGTVPELFEAVTGAAPATTILLEDGDYPLPRMLDLATPDVVLSGKNRDASRVLLHGTGMDERKVGVALSVSAPHITIAHLTVGQVGYHGIQIRGEKGASNTTVFGVRVFDTGQQLLKGSSGRHGRYADDGMLACSILEYTNHAPSDYTNAVDVLAANRWIVRDNRIHRIRGPREDGWKAGPAILFWANSQGTIVERNLVTDSYRGIAFGLGPGFSRNPRGGEERFDHQGGVIRDNVVVNLNAWADEGIEASAARDITIEGNTVVVEGRLPWSISLRFRGTTGRARKNLTNRAIVRRNGARADLADNVSNARREWFEDAERWGLRLRTDTPGGRVDPALQGTAGSSISTGAD